ncbi:hypothetical protein DXC09_02005 [Streptococcus vestibularis]|nr:hypothetical protein DXC09_02005 [Streptococcus vestibularis]
MRCSALSCAISRHRGYSRNFFLAFLIVCFSLIAISFVIYPLFILVKSAQITQALHFCSIFG